MPKNFSIHNILGIKEPEVVVLSSDSETEDDEAEVFKTETSPVSTNNNGAQMVEVGIFILECPFIELPISVFMYMCLRLLYIVFIFFIFSNVFLLLQLFSYLLSKFSIHL